MIVNLDASLFYPLQNEVDAIIRATVEMKASKPIDYRYGPNCGVLSVAICAGVTYEKALAAVQLRKGSKGGTNHAQREEALKRLGVKFETRHHRPAKTVKVFARDWTLPGVTYMLRVHKHVVTLRDGIVMDQDGVAPAALHQTANARVTISTRIGEPA